MLLLNGAQTVRFIWTKYPGHLLDALNQYKDASMSNESSLNSPMALSTYGSVAEPVFMLGREPVGPPQQAAPLSLYTHPVPWGLGSSFHLSSWHLELWAVREDAEVAASLQGGTLLRAGAYHAHPLLYSTELGAK